jgi:hypothetical protein
VVEIGFLAAMTAEGGDITGIARASEAAGFDFAMDSRVSDYSCDDE